LAIHAKVRIVFDPPIGMMDQSDPLPVGMPRRERTGPDFIDVVSARWLAPDDLPGAIDGVGIVDPSPLWLARDLAALPGEWCPGRP
jgi:hypothetical protein